MSFAHFAARRCFGCVRRVRNAGFAAWERQTDRAELVRAVRRERCAETSELRHAPQFDERTAEPPLDFLHLGEWHRLPPDRAAGERGEREPVEVRMHEHVHVHRRHALEHRRAMGLDARQNLAGVEAGIQHELEAVHHRAVEDDVAIDVGAGQRRDDSVERRLQMQLSGHGAVEDDGPVRLHRPLGMAGRA